LAANQTLSAIHKLVIKVSIQGEFHSEGQSSGRCNHPLGIVKYLYTPPTERTHLHSLQGEWRQHMQSSDKKTTQKRKAGKLL